jgi:two-component system NtrC family sensor kinase
LEGKVYQNASWFKEVMRKGYYISDVFLGYRRIPHFVIALAKEEMGKRWILRATIDTHLFNALVKKVRIGKTGEAYLLNAEGMFQTERRSGGSLMSKDPDIIPYPSSQKGIHTFFHRDGRGENYVYATTWLRNKKWLLVVRQEKADAFQSLRTATYLIILASIVGVMAIVLLAAYLTGRIVRRMEEMDSEKVRLSDQLVRASRLAELGEMAAGFAHEINNPLQIIKNEQALMAVLLSELKEAGELRPSESLKEIEDSMDQIDYQITRCAEITQAILKFGRQSEPHVKELDLTDFLPQVTGMVEKKASVHGIALTQRISQDVPPIHGDPGQLQQVLLNLYNNAIDAIVTRHGSAGGELSLDAARGIDGKVEIILRDNGCGISPENQKRIFTPFFTTKPMGKGTGLGLSVCYGIINNMGGVVEVSSEEGVGTSVAIRLPAAKR